MLKFKLLTLSLASIFITHIYANETSMSGESLPSPQKEVFQISKEDISQRNYQAVKWYRNSAERNTNYIQTYKLALEKTLKKSKQLKPYSWGVILDIDETVLDNSEYNYQNVINHTTYSQESNYTYMESAVSIAIPGAKNFTCNIKKHKGYVALVTNRDAKFAPQVINATVRNLKQQGICFDTVLFSTGSSDKNPRFKAVNSGNYKSITTTKKLPKIKVLAYFGDNIQDFPNITQKEAYLESQSLAYHKKFGDEYFILPNPVYGSFDKNSFE